MALPRTSLNEGHGDNALEVRRCGKGSFHGTLVREGGATGTKAPAARALTGQRLHQQLRLLGVHVVLRQRVDVREDEAHRAQRGVQLPQRVCPRLLGLRSEAATESRYRSRDRALPRRRLHCRLCAAAPAPVGLHHPPPCACLTAADTWPWAPSTALSMPSTFF